MDFTSKDNEGRNNEERKNTYSNMEFSQLNDYQTARAIELTTDSAIRR